VRDTFTTALDEGGVAGAEVGGDSELVVIGGRLEPDCREPGSAEPLQPLRAIAADATKVIPAAFNAVRQVIGRRVSQALTHRYDGGSRRAPTLWLA